MTATTAIAEARSYASTEVYAASHDSGRPPVSAKARKIVTASPISTENSGRLNATTPARVRRIRKLTAAPIRRAASSSSGGTKNSPTTTGASDSDMENACRRNSKCRAVASVIATATATPRARSRSCRVPAPVSSSGAHRAAATARSSTIRAASPWPPRGPRRLSAGAGTESAGSTGSTGTTASGSADPAGEALGIRAFSGGRDSDLAVPPCPRGDDGALPEPPKRPFESDLWKPISHA